MGDDGRFLKWNKGWDSLPCFKDPEIALRSYFDLIHPEDAQRTREIIKALAVNDHARIQNRLVMRKGENLWFEWMAWRPSGESVYLLGREIADQKRIEDELVELKSMLERKAAEWTSTLERQYSRRAALAEIELAINQPHELQHVLDRIAEVITHLLPASGGASIVLWDPKDETFFVSSSTVPNQPPQTPSMRVRRQGGATRWIVDNQKPFIVPDIRNDPFGANEMLREFGLMAYAGIPVLAEGQALGVLYALDVQTREYTEEDIDFLTSLAARAAVAIVKVRLYEKLKSANILLQQHSRELEIINKELKDFAYIISHDLKAPLRGICNLASWISEDYWERIDDKGRENLNLLIQRTKRMHKLVDAVLMYSRIGYVKEQKTEINLNRMVKEVIDLISPPPHIRITIENELPIIMGPSARIQQVFQNLLSNAVNFMDKEQGDIRIGCRDEGEFWKFHVSDNGPGIEERHFDRIFMIFQTLKPQDESDSTGVGLAVVKKTIDICGGRIWVESTPVKGSTFYFLLPKSCP